MELHTTRGLYLHKEHSKQKANIHALLLTSVLLSSAV